MVPEANVPMFSVVKVPEALLLVLAVRAERVATVDWVGCVQVEPMLRETESPADQVILVLVLIANVVVALDIANAVEPTQKFRALRALLGARFSVTSKLPDKIRIPFIWYAASPGIVNLLLGFSVVEFEHAAVASSTPEKQPTP